MQSNEINRRDFLRSTAAVGAGLMLSPTPLAQGQAAEGASPDEINVALIGAGQQGQQLIKTCQKIQGLGSIRFRALCDVWEQFPLMSVSSQLKRMGHEHRTYADYHEMLDQEKDLDAVIIATPDFCHAEQSVSCLKAGLHVYCESPMAHSLDGARKMVTAAKESGKLLQIGHQRRSNPRYIHCQQKLLSEAQLLGRITALNGRWNRPPQSDLGWPRTRALDADTLSKYGYKSMHQFKNWRWYRDISAGPVAGMGSHQLDVFNWFLNTPPKSITARGGTHYYDTKMHEWYDTVMVIMEFETPQGIVSALYQTLATNDYGGYQEVFMGDQGTLEIGELSGKCNLYRNTVGAPKWDTWVNLGFLYDPSKMKEEEPAKEGAMLDVHQTKLPPSYLLPEEVNAPTFQPHLENFFKAIRGQAELNCPPETGFQALATALKINQAVEEQRSIKCRPEDFVA